MGPFGAQLQLKNPSIHLKVPQTEADSDSRSLSPPSVCFLHPSSLMGSCKSSSQSENRYIHLRRRPKGPIGMNEWMNDWLVDKPTWSCILCLCLVYCRRTNKPKGWMQFSLLAWRGSFNCMYVSVLVAVIAVVLVVVAVVAVGFTPLKVNHYPRFRSRSQLATMPVVQTTKQYSKPHRAAYCWPSSRRPPSARVNWAPLSISPPQIFFFFSWSRFAILFPSSSSSLSAWEAPLLQANKVW